MSGTGEGKRQLVHGIKSDLARIRRECETLAHECEKIHEEAKGLSGWPAVWRGVSQLLSQAAWQLHEAERSDLKKLQGTLSSQIVTDLNHAHVEAVRAVRGIEGQGAAPPALESPNGNGAGEAEEAQVHGGESAAGRNGQRNGDAPREGRSDTGSEARRSGEGDAEEGPGEKRTRLLVPS